MNTLTVTAHAPSPHSGTAARHRGWPPLARAVLVERGDGLVRLTVWTNAQPQRICGRLAQCLGPVRAVEQKPDRCRMRGGNTVVIIVVDDGPDIGEIARRLFG